MSTGFEEGNALPAPGTVVDTYRVISRLGEGGMGHVLRVHDVAHDRPATIKFLHRDRRSDPASRERFATEGEMLSRVSHPHVVRAFGVGEWNGWPYLAMEFAEGIPLAEAGAPLPAADALRIASELAGAIAAVHSAGIVHRDVTPRNVILRTESGAACLLDFGLARRIDRSTVTSPGAGTLHFQAPEQVWGHRVGARADVYSFGALVYWMFAGHAPFADLPDERILHAVLHSNPRLLRHVRPDAPRAAAVLVARCLNRDPVARPADGAAVERLLASLRRGDRWPAAGLHTADPDLVPAGEDARLACRADAMNALAHALGDASQDRMSVVVAAGAPGNGASRLAREAERLARQHAMAVVVVRGSEFTESPFQALCEAAARTDAELGADTSADARRSRDVPTRHALAAEWIARLRRLTAAAPALLVADDAHLLDEVTFGVLVGALEHVGNVGVAALFTFRTTSPAAEPRIARLQALPVARRVDLPNLDAAGVATLAIDVLGVTGTTATRIAPRLHELTAGTPAQVMELLAVLSGRIGTGERLSASQVLDQLALGGLPGGARELAIRRCASLEPDLRQVLDVLATDTRGLECAVIARCTRSDELVTLHRLQRLARDHSLVRVDGDRYFIDSGDLRQSLRDALLAPMRRALHAEIARALRAQESPPAPAARLGWHLFHAGDVKEATPLLLAAGEAALDAHAPADARTLFELVADSQAQDAAATARVGLARALELLGDLDGARQQLAAVRREGGAAAGDATLWLATLERNRGRFVEALTIVREFDASGCSGDMRAALHLVRAHCAARIEGGGSEFDDALAAAAALEPHMGALRRVALHATHAMAARRRGDYVGAHAHWSEALHLARSAGLKEDESAMLANLTNVCLDLGRGEEAVEWARQAIDAALALGSERTAVYARIHFSDALLATGRVADAGSALDAAAPGVDLLGSDHASTLYFSQRAEHALAAGDTAEAEANVARALAHATAVPSLVADVRELEGRVAARCAR